MEYMCMPFLTQQFLWVQQHHCGMEKPIKGVSRTFSNDI